MALVDDWLVQWFHGWLIDESGQFERQVQVVNAEPETLKNFDWDDERWVTMKSDAGCLWVLSCLCSRVEQTGQRSLICV